MEHRRSNIFIRGKKKVYSRLLPVLAAICVCSFPVSAVYASDAADAAETDMTNTDAQTPEAEDVNLQSEIVQPDNLNQNGYDVIYLIDNSRSVWSQQDARNKAFRGISNLAVGSDIKIGVVYFADHVYEDYTKGLTSMETEDGCKEVLNALNMTAQDENNIDTNIGNALETAIKMYDGQDSSRQRIVVLFSDGINENFAQEEDYTKKANKKTKKMAQKLKEMNIPLYCVYLQQDRNDEKYLKKLVNYFSDEEDYTGSRFSKVEASEISSLLPTFTQVFYAMQNNMRYRELNLDSTGTTTFYVPSLGIKKMNIYVNMNTDTEIGVQGDSGEHSWYEVDGTFFTYNDPKPGEWWFRVKNDDLSQVYGTITYYADLSASAELIPVSTDEDATVADQYRLRVHFYDENGKEVSLDAMADVTVTLNYTGEDGTVNTMPIDMDVKEGMAVSKPFGVSGYGSYSYNINLGYEDVIELNYTIGGIALTKSAPITTDITDGMFEAEKTKEGGYQFAVKESKLWKDPEGEEVKIQGIAQINGANPVTCEQRDGYVYITAEKASDVEFSMDLEDTSGMTAVVGIKGKITDLGAVRMQKKLLEAAGALVLVVIVLKIFRKSNRKRKIQKSFEEFEELEKEIEDIAGECGKVLNGELNRQKEQMERYLYGVSSARISVPGIIEMSQELNDDLRSFLGAEKYMESDFCEKIFAGVDQWRADLKEALSATLSLKEQEQKLRNLNPKDRKKMSDRKVLREIQSLTKKTAPNLGKVKTAQDNLKKKTEEVKKSLEEIGKTGDQLAELTLNKIKCRLTVKEISCCPNVMGVMNACGFDGKYNRSCYGLGEVELIGMKNLTLGDMVDPLDIYVYGYEEDQLAAGGAGVRLKGFRKFIIEDNDPEAETKAMQTDKAVLLAGHTYTLTVDTRIGMVQMKLIVKRG